MTHLFYKSLLLSILIHTTIHHLFTFTFPLKPITKKPDFSFLGSILTQNDVSDLNRVPKLYRMPPFIHHDNAQDQPEYFEHIHKSINKSTASAQNLKQPKITLKTYFAYPEYEEQPEDLGIPLDNIAPYKPLKFKAQ